MPKFPFPYSSQKNDSLDKFYDLSKSLLRLPLSRVSRNEGFLYDKIYVHPTRESLDYAFLLLSKGIFSTRAEAILKTICSLQNKDLSSPNHGGWPKYLESIFFRRAGEYWKFDRNWTEFISLILLEILINKTYVEELCPDLVNDIKVTVHHATQAIKKRNVPHIYTNICVMGLCIALIAAHFFKDDELYRYGKDKLDVFHENTLLHGCFAEYNSTTYSLLTVRILFYLKTRLRENFSPEEELVRTVEHLYNLSYLEIISFFHFPTGQWAGPHSRSYSPLINPEISSLLIESLPQSVENSKDKVCSLRQSKRMLTRCMPYKSPPQVLSAYMTPTFTIGSVNYSDLWSQRNALIAYWGDEVGPFYCRLRCLHNYKDSSAAQLFSVQSENTILGAINFATDVSKENPYLPQTSFEKRGIPTYDLRVRFEFGSSLEIPDFIQISQNENVLVFKVNAKYFSLYIPYARFEFRKLNYKVSYCRKTQTVGLDIIIHSRWLKSINFSKIDIALISFCFQMADKLSDLSHDPIDLNLSSGNLVILKNDKLSLSVLQKPEKIKELRSKFTSHIFAEPQ